MKIKKDEFYIKYLEIAMSSPFSDNVLGIKMCVELYIKEEYAKLY